MTFRWCFSTQICGYLLKMKDKRPIQLCINPIMECHCCKGFEYCSFEKNGVFHLQIRGKTHDIYLEFPLEIGINTIHVSFLSLHSARNHNEGNQVGNLGKDTLTNHHHLGGFPNRLRSESLRWWLVAFPKDPLNNKQTCYNMVDITKQHLEIHLKVILDPC